MARAKFNNQMDEMNSGHLNPLTRYGYGLFVFKRGSDPRWLGFGGR